MLGPLLRAEEGDNIIVYFKNKAHHANKKLSMHPHGLLYVKEREGKYHRHAIKASQKKIVLSQKNNGIFLKKIVSSQIYSFATKKYVPSSKYFFTTK